MHPRVKYLKPGIGIGGHFIPIDPLFFDKKMNLKMIKTSININHSVINNTSKEILSKSDVFKKRYFNFRYYVQRK